MPDLSTENIFFAFFYEKKNKWLQKKEKYLLENSIVVNELILFPIRWSVEENWGKFFNASYNQRHIKSALSSTNKKRK